VDLRKWYLANRHTIREFIEFQTEFIPGIFSEQLKE